MSPSEGQDVVSTRNDNRLYIDIGGYLYQILKTDAGYFSCPGPAGSVNLFSLAPSAKFFQAIASILKHCE
jgi:hypothetical protein